MDNKKCIIDNWSLEHAGILLDDYSDIHEADDTTYQNNLGGLSNYINVLLLYEESGYLKNGFENQWTRFSRFEQNTSSFLKAFDPSISKIDWNSPASYDDNGISNYLTTSELFGADLFVSPERASKVTYNEESRIDDNFIATLKNIDDHIHKLKDEAWYKNVRIGINDNFMLPSLTQYVLSQATSREDLFSVIMQIKSDGKISRIKERINELISNTKSSMKFQKEIENIISDSFGLKSNKDHSWSISISALFLSLSKSFSPNFFNRSEHIVFLKDIVGLRVENRRLQKDIERVFKRSVIK